VSLHPVNEIGNLGVDSRVVETSTSNAPADNASKITRSVGIVANHGPTTVTLATVLAILSSANHALGNLERVLKLASTLRDNRNCNHHQLVRGLSTRAKSSPSRDIAASA